MKWYNYIDKCCWDKLKNIKKRKDEVVALDKLHVYTRGSGSSIRQKPTTFYKDGTPIPQKSV